jgi:hypothetical protein
MTRQLTRLAIAAALLLSLPVANLQAKEWRGITPLKSKRADVERLLGQPHQPGRYQYEDLRVSIDYAEGKCDEDNTDCRCFVSEDTVLSIFVVLEVGLKFSTLNLDETKYKKSVYPEDPNLAIYSNDEEGIIYTVSQEDGEVTAIEYLPSAKDCEDLITRQGRRQSD